MSQGLIKSQAATGLSAVAAIVLVAVTLASALLLAHIYHLKTVGMLVPSLPSAIDDLLAIFAMLMLVVISTLGLGFFVHHHAISLQDTCKRAVFDRFRLENAIDRDPTTGLASSAGFETALQSRLSVIDQTGTNAYVVIIWLGPLMIHTSSFGRLAFERLVQLLATRLHACLDPDDRIGWCEGREFRLLIHQQGCLARIADTLSHQLMLEGVRIAIDGRMGVARFPAEARAAQSLLDLAWADLLQKPAVELNPSTAQYSQAAVQDRRGPPPFGAVPDQTHRDRLQQPH